MCPDADDDRRPLTAWRAEDYDRGRPGWPPKLIDTLFDELGLGRDSHVLDLAAGTGKLTLPLAERAMRVTAVEPSPAMRAVLERRAPDHVTVLAGAAEAIPLPDQAVDGVFVAEAWHWFDAEAALAEIERVGGSLALLWNVPRETMPLGPLRRLADEIAGPKKRAYDGGGWRTPVEEALGPLTYSSADHTHRLDPDTYLAMVASWSWVAALPDDERTTALEQLRDDLPAEIALSYRAEAWSAAGRAGR